MESYISFLNRTNSFETERFALDNRYFVPRDSLKAKVNMDCKFKEFCGDTVVFTLPVEVISKISGMIDILYREVPECFATRLPDETLHMTLHDLVNSESTGRVRDLMIQNSKLMEQIKQSRMIPHREIRLKTNYIINMVNTSLVLAIQPCSKSDYQRLMKTYNIFEEVVKLPYPFTPHITLAYYNVNGFEATSSRKLSKVVTSLNHRKNYFEFCIDTSRLVYQTFTSMKDYKDVIVFD